jgi:glycine cleavage system H lipoate-binding protein
MATSFTHAVVDDMGDIIRKYRWSAKEAKWHKEQGSNVIKLEVVKEVKEDISLIVGECLF